MADEHDPNGPVRVALSDWQAVASIVVGLVLVGISLAFKLWIGSEDAFRVVLCVGLGLILAGLGVQVSGSFKSWNVAGGGAASIVILMLYYYLAPPVSEPPVDPAIEATVEGNFPQETTSLGIAAHGGRKLLGTWQRVHQNYMFRVEKSHIKRGCISFTIFSISNNGTDSFVTYVPANFFKKFFNKASSKSTDAATPLEINLQYQYVANGDIPRGYIFSSSDPSAPISRDRCFGARNVGSNSVDNARLRLERLTGRLANILFRPTLAAELKKLSNEKLIQNLRSPNSSVQREAGALLAEDGPEQLIKVMESLHKDPNNRRVQKGTLAVLSTIMNNDVDAKLVRGKLTKADVSAIAKLIGDNDRLLGNEAALTTAYLNDPRANETLSDIVMGQYSSYAKVKAASVLNQNFNYFTDPQKSRLKSKLAPSFSSYDLRIQELTKGIINYRPDRAPTKTGWVYLGTNFGSGWDEHYFSTKTKSEIPKPGDDLTTTGNINIRKDHIKFDPKKGWTNAPSIGVLKTNQTVRVKKLKIVAGGFYWAQIERR